MSDIFDQNELPMGAVDKENPIDTDMEKIEILKKAKEEAINGALIKTASFTSAVQDPYPSPFLNLSDTSIPRTVNEIYKWCKYFYTFDPLISGAINSLATFPVTELHLEDRPDHEGDDESAELGVYKNCIFKKLNMHKLMIEIGIDYYLYGNCIVFGEMHKNTANNEIEWKTIVRLDVSKIIIDYNPATQEKKYKWEVPASVKRIVNKKAPKEEYDKIPDIIKEAVKKKGVITLNSNNVYHFPRPTDSMGENAVWGVPVVANVLKLLMYRNTLRQAQEAIAREHIVPMRIYSLRRDQNFDPTTDWNNVAQNLASELMKSTRDPNYKVVSPIPVDVANIGGHGRSLLLTPEIEQIQAEILAGMNIPREFIFGGVSYSSSSISLKILENQFITYRLLLKDFIQNFIIRNMAKARKEWLSEKDDDSLVVASLVDLKMQDDVQQKQTVLQLNQAGKVTDEYMWKTMNMDPEKMKAAMEKEQMEKIDSEKKIQIERVKSMMEVKKAEIAAEIELMKYKEAMMRKYQVNEDPQAQGNAAMQGQQMPGQGQAQAGQEQQMMGQEQAQGGDTAEDLQQEAQPEEGLILTPEEEERKADKIAKALLNKTMAEREQFLASIPQYFRDKIVAKMEQQEASNKPATINSVDMRPLPEKLPPRRKSLQ